jgi:hypothetical protein
MLEEEINFFISEHKDEIKKGIIREEDLSKEIKILQQQVKNCNTKDQQIQELNQTINVLTNNLENEQMSNKELKETIKNLQDIQKEVELIREEKKEKAIEKVEEIKKEITNYTKTKSLVKPVKKPFSPGAPTRAEILRQEAIRKKYLKQYIKRRSF